MKLQKEQLTTPNKLQVPESIEDMKKSSRSQISKASDGGKAGKKLGNAFGLTKDQQRKGRNDLYKIEEDESDDFKHEERKKRQRKLHKGASNDEEKASKGKGKHQDGESENGEESKTEEEDEEKRSQDRQKKRHEDVRLKHQNLLLEQERDVIVEFSKYTNKRKVIQAAGIIILLMIMASYFLIKFLLSLRMHGQIKSSLDDLETIYSRLSCSQNVINQFTEAYFLQNTESGQDIQNAKDFVLLDQKIQKCMELEMRFSQVVIVNPEDYFEYSGDFLYNVERGKFLCDNTTLQIEVCLSLSDQIRKQGLSTYYFNIMKSVKQL